MCGGRGREWPPPPPGGVDVGHFALQDLLMKEEVFGPVLTAYVYADETISRANRTCVAGAGTGRTGWGRARRPSRPC